MINSIKNINTISGMDMDRKEKGRIILLKSRSSFFYFLSFTSLSPNLTFVEGLGDLAARRILFLMPLKTLPLFQFLRIITQCPTLIILPTLLHPTNPPPNYMLLPSRTHMPKHSRTHSLSLGTQSLGSLSLPSLAR